MTTNSPAHKLNQAPLLTKNILVAITYLLFGVSASFLTIPPDYATPVWPAAGIALGFALRFGPSVFPGIFVGAILTNATFAHLQGVAFSYNQFFFATSVATGATFQVAIARHIINKLSLVPKELQHGADIVKFLLIIGPVGCLLNSLVGATMLAACDIAPWELWLSNWLTWWVGDSIGSMVITPLVLHLTEFKKNQEHRRVSTFISLSFLVLVIISFFYVRSLEEDSRKAQIAETGEHMAVILKSHLLEVELVLNSLKSFFEASNHVSLSDFNQFSSTLLPNQQAVHVFQWLPYVLHEQRDEIEGYLKANGFPDFTFKAREISGQLSTIGIRDDYMPIMYTYPFEGNEKIHGMDVLSLPYREKQSRLALNTGKPYASEPLVLVQGQAGETAYIVVRAVSGYRGEGNTGVVQVLFKISNLLKHGINEEKLNQGFSLIDVTDPTQVTTIYGDQPTANDYSWQSEFNFLNRKISVHLSPTIDLLKKVSSWQSYTLLIGGLLYVAILEAVLLSLLTRQRAIQFEVDKKTSEITEAQKRAEKASEAKTDFLVNISHELRTPLNAVIGFTHRVINQKDSNIDSQNLEALKIVEKNGQHLLGLLNNLLDITQIENGRMELEYSKFNLVMLMSETCKHFYLATNKKKNDLILRTEDANDGIIEADAPRIRQVLMNLISNAIKFTSNGTITVSLGQSKDKKGYNITVEDTGIGIAEEDLPKLFDQFQRVGNTSRLNPHGTGLGLTLSKEIIELHGGSIKAESELTKGSRFIVWLPIKPENQTNV